MPKLNNNTCRSYPNTTRLLEERIYAKRKEMKLSQEALADKMGVTRNCIQQMECHEHLPQLFTVFDLLEALGFDKKESDDFMSELRNAYREDKGLLNEKEEPEAV